MATATIDPYRVVKWFFTKAFTRYGIMKNKLEALKALWLYAEHCFSISPVHSEDNHISVRIQFSASNYENIHLFLQPGTSRITHATTINFEEAGTQVVVLWTNQLF